MSRIFVLDAQRRPLMPCTPARARILLKAGKAVILRRFPLVIMLKAPRPDAIVSPLRVKLDPGATTSGIAVTNDKCSLVTLASPQSADMGHTPEALVSGGSPQPGNHEI